MTDAASTRQGSRRGVVGHTAGWDVSQPVLRSSHRQRARACAPTSSSRRMRVATASGAPRKKVRKNCADRWETQLLKRRRKPLK